MIRVVVGCLGANLVAICVMTGCSENSDIRTHHVSGTVSFKGAPVPAGNIQFAPAKGNSGPAGFAKIQNGKFDTSAEGCKGTVGGLHRVIITGFDGQANPAAELPQGKQLFPEFTVQFDIPMDGGPVTKDFEVTIQKPSKR